MTTQNERIGLINKIRQLPFAIEKFAANLTAEQLTSNFPGNEWTVAQNVHHLADSHMNSYIRCKLIASEKHPPLKPYDQDLWAAFPDANKTDISGSLQLLKCLHVRWVEFFVNLPADGWQRTGFHPVGGTVTFDSQLQLYADHGEAHIGCAMRIKRDWHFSWHACLKVINFDR